MTEPFTASNGVTVKEVGAGLYVEGDGVRLDRLREKLQAGSYGDVTPAMQVALREFFQHERDKELGRWRWPENPDYVVYPVIHSEHEMAFGQNLSVMVFHEPTGVLKGYCREEDQGGDLTREYPGAARAYFKAHPERKPWDTASAGELWAFKIDPETRETLWERDASESHWHLPGRTKAELGIRFTIVTGRKIWPEDAS